MKPPHHVPHPSFFCWITATVPEDALTNGEGGELPMTLTEMYIYFVMFHIHQTKKKYSQEKYNEYIKSLAKLAFEQLQKGKQFFDESDLTVCGIDIRAASVYSGVFTQIL
ncbi:hypothetical protein L3Q82_005561 [Scortum barcoo]|uniref:Uncharacterized protein n=1 Tax=Scortum barcoo TaxID=214431 RepID=A0ACB8VBF2_9TELE|nr:hypothetical protein L3Q82_005561 [Scortum barcoo]